MYIRVLWVDPRVHRLYCCCVLWPVDRAPAMSQSCLIGHKLGQIDTKWNIYARLNLRCQPKCNYNEVLKRKNMSHLVWILSTLYPIWQPWYVCEIEVPRAWSSPKPCRKNAPPINLLAFFVNKSHDILSAQALFKKKYEDLDTIKSQPVQIIMNMQNT